MLLISFILEGERKVEITIIMTTIAYSRSKFKLLLLYKHNPSVKDQEQILTGIR